MDDIDATKPICTAVEERFKAVGLGAFQKLRAAMELQRRREAGESMGEKTLANFAELFQRLTDALKKA